MQCVISRPVLRRFLACHPRDIVAFNSAVRVLLQLCVGHPFLRFSCRSTLVLLWRSFYLFSPVYVHSIFTISSLSQLQRALVQFVAICPHFFSELNDLPLSFLVMSYGVPKSPFIAQYFLHPQPNCSHNKHLMTGPTGNSEFCFCETLNVPRGEVLLYLPTQNRTIHGCQLTTLLQNFTNLNNL